MLTGEHRDRGLPRNFEPEGYDVHGTGPRLERATEPKLGELDVLLGLRVLALDLDPGLQTDGEPLDLLIHGPALDPHLALDDPTRYDIEFGQLGLHRSTTGTHAREQPLEAHVYSSLVLPLDTRHDRGRFPVPSDAMIEGPDRTPLTRDFFDRPVLEVAPDLLGRTLVRTTPDGPIELRLTEVEAYAGEIDLGSHAFRGRTSRNSVMYGPPEGAYVYFTYGMSRQSA